MALYTYKKAPIKIQNPDERENVNYTPPKRKNKLTIGDVVGGGLHDINNLIISSRIAGFFIPLILITIGVFVIYKQVWPDIDQTLRQWAGYYNTESLSLVAGDYVERANYLSDPGAAYFKDLTQSAAKSNNLLPDPVSDTYQGTFDLTIESLGLYNLKVTANVDSSIDSNYLKYLNHGLAHFKGTGLPISDVNNNIVIYGHSSSGDYYERTHDTTGAFSMLNQIKIGAIVKIDMAGKTYLFRVNKSKIVQPDDVSIIIGTPGVKTLTLFTCFPNGNSTSRFVAVGVPV